MRKLTHIFIISFAVFIIAAVVIFSFSGVNTSNNLNNNYADKRITTTFSGSANNVDTGIVSTTSGNIQEVKLSVSGSTYILSPSVLKKGVPVKLIADMNNMPGCSKSVVIRDFGVSKYVKSGDNIIEFTPDKTGTFKIACSMNMYIGSFTVTGDGLAPTGAEAVQVANAQKTITKSAGGGCTMGAGGGGCGCGG